MEKNVSIPCSLSYTTTEIFLLLKFHFKYGAEASFLKGFRHYLAVAEVGRTFFGTQNSAPLTPARGGKAQPKFSELVRSFWGRWGRVLICQLMEELVTYNPLQPVICSLSRGSR